MAASHVDGATTPLDGVTLALVTDVPPAPPSPVSASTTTLPPQAASASAAMKGRAQRDDHRRIERETLRADAMRSSLSEEMVSATAAPRREAPASTCKARAPQALLAAGTGSR